MPKTFEIIDSQFRTQIHGHGRVRYQLRKPFHALATHDSPTECIVPSEFSDAKCAEKCKSTRETSFFAYVSTPITGKPTFPSSFIRA